MKRTTVLLLLVIFLAACSNNEVNPTVSPTVTPQLITPQLITPEQSADPVASASIDEVTTPLPSESSSPSIVSSKEFYNLEDIVLYEDINDLDNNKHKKEVNEGAGETTFFVNVIEYTYFSYSDNEEPKLVSVKVTGNYEGIRGIRIGDRFEDVLKLFPQERNWEEDENGVFYGEMDTTSYGYVSEQDSGKELTIATEEVHPFLRIFFDKENKISYFTLYISPLH